jgi:hypothetical protein
MNAERPSRDIGILFEMWKPELQAPSTPLRYATLRMSGLVGVNSPLPFVQSVARRAKSKYERLF